MLHVCFARVHVESAAGNYRMVAEGGRQGSEWAASAGMIWVEILETDHEATGWAALGEISRLQDALSRLRRMIAGTCFAFYECQARFLETYAEFVRGDPERGRRLLADAIALARETQFQYPQMTRYSIVPGAVLAEALRSGIETDYVRDTIRRLHIKPPADGPEKWPWPVKIHTLGRFEVLCDDEKLEFPGRAPRKVLAVLKAIVAGGGEAVAIAHLTDVLWPDEDGDAARKAFDVALVRLRRLLGDRNAVTVQEEQVALNPDVCWVDAWSFARNVSTVERGEGTWQTLLRVGQRALDSYRGPFLPAEPEDKGCGCRTAQAPRSVCTAGVSSRPSLRSGWRVGGGAGVLPARDRCRRAGRGVLSGCHALPRRNGPDGRRYSNLSPLTPDAFGGARRQALGKERAAHAVAWVRSLRSKAGRADADRSSAIHQSRWGYFLCDL